MRQLVGMLVVIALGWSAMAEDELAPRVVDGKVLFSCKAPDAREVYLAGSFNGWEATPLADPDGDGIWMASIPLPPGRYEYAFVIDGRWWGQDPLADELVRSFGDYSSVRYVGHVGDGA